MEPNNNSCGPQSQLRKQITLELNNKIIHRSLAKVSLSETKYPIYPSCQSDFAYTYIFERWLKPFL